MGPGYILNTSTVSDSSQIHSLSLLTTRPTPYIIPVLMIIGLLKPNLKPNNRNLKQKVYISLMKKSEQAGDPEVKVALLLIIALLLVVTQVHCPYDTMHEVGTGPPPPC